MLQRPSICIWNFDWFWMQDKHTHADASPAFFTYFVRICGIQSSNFGFVSFKTVRHRESEPWTWKSTSRVLNSKRRLRLKTELLVNLRYNADMKTSQLLIGRMNASMHEPDATSKPELLVTSTQTKSHNTVLEGWILPLQCATLCNPICWIPSHSFPAPKS